MRRSARVDDNQAAVVAALRKIGASVQSIAVVGQGCPDLLVGLSGVNHVLEVKDGSKYPSQRRLTKHEEHWVTNWRGRVVVVNNAEEAIAAVRDAKCP